MVKAIYIVLLLLIIFIALLFLSNINYFLSIIFTSPCISYTEPVYEGNSLIYCDQDWCYYLGDKIYFGTGLDTSCANLDYTFAWKALLEDGPFEGTCYPEDCGWNTVGRFQESGDRGSFIFTWTPPKPGTWTVTRWVYDWCDGTTTETEFHWVYIHCTDDADCGSGWYCDETESVCGDKTGVCIEGERPVTGKVELIFIGALSWLRGLI